MFYLTTHSTHFVYDYMELDTDNLDETHCHHLLVYSFQLTVKNLLYAPFHRQDSPYHSLCYTSCGAVARCKRKKEIFTDCAK